MTDRAREIAAVARNRAELISDRVHARVEAVLQAVPPIDPPPSHWLNSDSCYSYCWPCAVIARGREFELGPLIKMPDRWLRDEWDDAFFEGIDGGFDTESETSESCEICGTTLSYILTDYGIEQETTYWLENPLVDLRDEDSFAADRLALNVFPSMARNRLLAVSACIGQAYRLIKRPHESGNLPVRAIINGETK